MFNDVYREGSSDSIDLIKFKASFACRIPFTKLAPIQSETIRAMLVSFADPQNLWDFPIHSLVRCIPKPSYAGRRSYLLVLELIIVNLYSSYDEFYCLSTYHIIIRPHQTHKLTLPQ